MLYYLRLSLSLRAIVRLSIVTWVTGIKNVNYDGAVIKTPYFISVSHIVSTYLYFSPFTILPQILSELHQNTDVL